MLKRFFPLPILYVKQSSSSSDSNTMTRKSPRTRPIHSTDKRRKKSVILPRGGSVREERKCPLTLAALLTHRRPRRSSPSTRDELPLPPPLHLFSRCHHILSISSFGRSWLDGKPHVYMCVYISSRKTGGRKRGSAKGRKWRPRRSINRIARTPFKFHGAHRILSDAVEYEPENGNNFGRRIEMGRPLRLLKSGERIIYFQF